VIADILAQCDGFRRGRKSGQGKGWRHPVQRQNHQYHKQDETKPYRCCLEDWCALIAGASRVSIRYR
jgi:hypothetical protein